jgi:hypothetical protein
MNPFLKSNYEKILVSLAAGAVLLSLGWAWRQQRELRAMDEARDARPTLAGRTYAPSAWRVATPERPAWGRAPEQSAGSGWLYELFTPPVIYYNTGARSFAVTPPQYPVAEGDANFGSQLVGVKRGLFRLQLVGYFGSPDNYLLAFESPGSPETMLARVGRRFEELGLTLKSFEVKKVPVEHDEPWPVYDVAGLATLIDERTGAEVVLDTRMRKFTDAALAVFQPAAAGSRPRELREGDSYADEGASYRVERIQLDPAEVIVSRSVPGLPVPETRALRPAPPPGSQVAGKSTGAPELSSLPKRGVANNGP